MEGSKLKQNSKEDRENMGFLANINRKMLDTSSLLGLLKWNTPTIYNGWEQITTNPNYGRSCFNLEPIIDHSPEMGSMVGYAVTVKINPGKIEDLEKEVKKGNKGMWSFMATLPTHIPKVGRLLFEKINFTEIFVINLFCSHKIVVVEDLSKPVIYGSMWGEVNATFFKSVGAVGCITDGGVRDLDEMKNVGFHAMSRGVTISHSYGVMPVEFDVPVSAFGVTVKPGQLIHADKHGFLVVPEEDEEKLLEASDYMDMMERKLVLVPGREGTGKHPKEIAKKMEEVCAKMNKEKVAKYGSFRDKFPDFKS